MLLKHNIAEFFMCTKLFSLVFETICCQYGHLINRRLWIDSGFGDEGVFALSKRNEGY